MNKKISITFLTIAALLGMFVQASAKTSTEATSTKAMQTEAMSKTVSRADREIDRRIKAMNDLIARIQSMERLTGSEKSNLSSSLQSQIGEMNSLKAKIDADTDLATLRTDVQSLTKSYRIFALVMPVGNITAAADRVLTIADTITAVGTKLQTRISESQSAGKNVTVLQSLYADLAAKLADAKSQAQAAVSGVSALTPDNGDQTKYQANHKALLDARAKIQAATKDVQAARKDAGDIVKALRSLGRSKASSTAAMANSTGTPTTSAQ